MLTLSRSLVRQLRILLSRALDLPARLHNSCPLHLESGPQGLVVRAQLGDYAAEYRQLTPQPQLSLVTSFQLFKATESTKPDPVTFDRDDKGATRVGWHEGPVPRVMTEDPPHVDPGAKFPDSPAIWSTNPPALWRALSAAYGTTDPESSRYALGCIQLRGTSGHLAATDGSQLYRESGFAFGWEEEVLIRGLKLFTTKELPSDQPVEIALHDKRVVLRSGSWTFWLPVQEGRFPRVDDVVPVPTQTKTRLNLPSAQQQFLKENLPRLQGGGLPPCVTVDLNGHVAIRSRESDGAPPTQLTLTKATYEGEPMQVVTARRYLQRALDLGFQEVHLVGPQAVIVCRDGTRDYTWMAIDPQSAVQASADMVEIIAPDHIAASRVRRTSVPEAANVSISPPPTTVTMSETTSAPRARMSRGTPLAETSLIEQAQGLRSKLHELLVETGELVRSAKRQKQQERLVRTTLASLKELQAAG